MKKISEWLGELDGHDAISVELSRPVFEKETGKTWPAYLSGQPVKAELRAGRRDPKGLQSWGGDESHPCYRSL